MRVSYSVRPFSGPRFHENAERCRGNQMPCTICGNPIKDPAKAKQAIVINGGAAWGDENSPRDAGYMGAFPIGPDCHRKYAIELPATQEQVEEQIADLEKMARQADWDAESEFPGETFAKQQHRATARRRRAMAEKVAAAWRATGGAL